MSILPILGFLALGVVFVSLLVFVYAVRKAPNAVEDANGFHFLDQSEAPLESARHAAPMEARHALAH